MCIVLIFYESFASGVKKCYSNNGGFMKVMDDRLKKQMEFILKADEEKFIERKTLVSSGERFENDAEHAWHMALMCVLLSEYANEPIDVLKTVKMILIHDIVEIESGDTYAYDEAGKATQHERELPAADKLFNMLPEDQTQEYFDLWLEFENQKTAEAKFARSMDNIQPNMLNHATNGEMWKRNQIKLSQVLKRNEPTKYGSEILWDFQYNQLIKPNVDKGCIINDMENNKE